MRHCLSTSIRTCTAALVASSALTAADGPSFSMSLQWRPTSPLSDTTERIELMPFANVKVALKPLVDQRKDKTFVGENREKGYSRYVTTTDDVPVLLTSRVLDLMKEAGLPVSDKVEGANLVLTGEILRYGVTETQTYKGELRLLLEIHSGDKSVWKGMVVGRASRFGRSYKPENYQEVLSDVVVEAVSRMLSDQTFLRVLSGKAMVVPIPAAN